MTLSLSPSLEELERIHGKKPKPGRELTAAERKQAKADRKAKPKHLETKTKSEALCKRQLEKWGAWVRKARDDERNIKGKGMIRISTDVDWVGDIPLNHPKGGITSVPLRCESKGITLKATNHRYNEDGSVTFRHKGTFPLSNLSTKERGYLTANRLRGGLSTVHIAWWYEGVCQMCHLIPWRDWPTIEVALLSKVNPEKKGGYRGKSIRYHADYDVLVGYVITKVSGQWQLEHGHWLRSLLPIPGEQPELL